MARIDSDVIKTSKPFRKFDLCLYISVSVMILVLFLCYNPFGKDKAVSQIEISLNGELIYVYDFSLSESTLTSEAITEEKDGDFCRVKVTAENGFNLIEIDVSSRTARVIDADCSSRKDCVHTKAVRSGGDVIVCVPHKLVVTAVGDGIRQPVTG